MAIFTTTKRGRAAAWGTQRQATFDRLAPPSGLRKPVQPSGEQQCYCLVIAGTETGSRPGRSKTLPKLVSTYALIFFLGSITRYRPAQFHRIVNGKYSAQIQAILNDIPSQFLYQLASNSYQQEIAKAAII